VPFSRRSAIAVIAVRCPTVALALLVACHRPQFVMLPAPGLAQAELHFASRFGRPLHIDAVVESGTLGAGVLDSTMKALPRDSLSAALDTMAAWLYAELGRPRAVTGIVLSVQVGENRPVGVIWSAPGHEPRWMQKR
jgi:hypothetical protein